jgi:hypothetical protein
VLDRLFAQVGRNSPVEALENEPSGRHVIGNDVEEPDHLGEDEHSVAVGSEALKQLVKEDHLAGIEHEAAQNLRQRLVAILSTVKEVRVVGSLFQFHRHVHERDLLGPAAAQHGKVLR